MTALSKIQSGMLLSVKAPSLLFGKFGKLFVLSHMRSYSSLLCRILGEHAEILGVGELHLSYDTAWSGFTQRRRIYETCGAKGSARYLCDKLLHNCYVLPLELAKKEETLVIIMVRDPYEALPSIVRMGRELVSRPTGWSVPRQAISYYCERVNDLADFARRLSGRYFYFDAAQIVEAPDILLQDLTEFIQLTTPLRSEYSVDDTMGRPGLGDRSSALRHGAIQRPMENAWDQYVEEFSEAALREVSSLYQQQRDSLVKGSVNA